MYFNMKGRKYTSVFVCGTELRLAEHPYKPDFHLIWSYVSTCGRSPSTTMWKVRFSMLFVALVPAQRSLGIPWLFLNIVLGGGTIQTPPYVSQLPQNCHCHHHHHLPRVGSFLSVVSSREQVRGFTKQLFLYRQPPGVANTLSPSEEPFNVSDEGRQRPQTMQNPLS